jgi:transcriptional regulator with XRE-family HTH domain
MGISSNQLRSARAHLNLGLKEVSAETNIGTGTISDLEQEKTANPRMGTLESLRKFYELNGVEFTDDGGIRPHTARFRHLKGVDGFRALMDDVYGQAKDKGGKFRLWNARPAYFIKWLGKDWYEEHTDRMKPLLGNISFNVTCEEGDTNFIGGKFAEYRWVPKKIFNEQAIYCYGNRIAFLNFDNDSIEIFILHSKEFNASFCLLFDFVWDEITTIPDMEGYKP